MGLKFSYVMACNENYTSQDEHFVSINSEELRCFKLRTKSSAFCMTFSRYLIIFIREF